MKKVKVMVAALLLLGLTPNANADVYVKVDANGNAVGEAIVCEISVCGNANSSYAKATLKPGETYALQGLGSTGIGNNNPNVQLKVDLQTNEWAVTTTHQAPPNTSVIINNTPVIVEAVQTVDRFNPVSNVALSSPIKPQPYETPTAQLIFDTATVESKTEPVDPFWSDWLEQWLKFWGEWTLVFAWDWWL